MPLAVARRLEDDEEGLTPAAEKFLRDQSVKTAEQRLTDIELWQVGANEYLATINDLRELLDWLKTRVSRWLPIIAGAALGSHTLADFVTRMYHAAGYQ